MRSIYISCPISISQNYLDQIYHKLNDFGSLINPYYWERDSKYDKDNIKVCDAIVIVHPNNAFKYDINSLPVGIQKEINKALDLDKKVFGVYRNISGESHFYDVIAGLNHDFELVKGSTNSLYNYLNELNDDLDLDFNSFENTSKENEKIHINKYSNLLNDELLLIK